MGWAERRTERVSESGGASNWASVQVCGGAFVMAGMTATVIKIGGWVMRRVARRKVNGTVNGIRMIVAGAWQCE